MHRLHQTLFFFLIMKKRPKVINVTCMFPSNEDPLKRYPKKTDVN